METRPYVADEVSGLQIIDVRDSSTPTTDRHTRNLGMGLGASPCRLMGTQHTSRMAPVVFGSSMSVIQNTPTLTGTLAISAGYAYGVTLSADGNTAYVADSNSGLRIIDVSDSSNPTLIETFDTSGSPRSVTLSADGNTAYVADEVSGLQIIDVRDSSTPTLTGTVDTSGSAYGVTLSADGNTAYVADFSSGLQIIDLVVEEFSTATDTVSITVDSVNDLGAFIGDTSGTGAEDSSLTGTLTFTDAADGASASELHRHRCSIQRSQHPLMPALAPGRTHRPNTSTDLIHLL